ncbi:MAG: beta-N-acetylhexosaminidase [Paludibacter sp.]
MKINNNILKAYLAVLIMISTSVYASSAKEIGLIPLPQKYEPGKGVFEINSKTKVVLEPDNVEMRDAAGLLVGLFQKAAGFSLNISSKKEAKNVITCRIVNGIDNKEGYRIKVSPNTIVIEGATAIGIFYGLQTIRQLLPSEIENAVSVGSSAKWIVPCMSVSDYPEFGYRGMMLDVCRHFMPKEFVMKFIDMMALHKLNIFHWHLTDDQGWRIEIKKYPKLIEIGAFRRMEIAGHKNSPDWTWKVGKYGGFYTQEDIREVVVYAKKRNVTIIPEIELPGHAMAALSAYPELSCSGGPFEVVGRWGVFQDIYCSREETILFLQDVLNEIADLFPGDYIHLGGDEAPKTRWQRCKACQEIMAKEGLKNEIQLQTYFMGRMEKLLNKKGKKVICWDEVVEGGMSKTVTIMSWRGEEGGIQAARNGNDVIMTPNKLVYFDYYQGDKISEPPAIGGFLPLEKVYEYSPVPKELTSEEAKHIKGVQANVWTEYMPDEKQVEYMVFPRIAALAEVAWSSQDTKNLENFKIRLANLIEHYSSLKINYRKSGD